VRAQLYPPGQRPRPELQLGARHQDGRIAEGVEMTGVVVVQMSVDQAIDLPGVDADAAQGLQRLDEELAPTPATARGAVAGIDHDRLRR
jgi:hypothetical protein